MVLFLLNHCKYDHNEDLGNNENYDNGEKGYKKINRDETNPIDILFHH